jgi:predicted neuraminidase
VDFNRKGALYNMFIFNTDACFSQCHASTLTLMLDGRVGSAWFAGTAEGRDDTAIFGAFTGALVDNPLDELPTWSEPIKLVKVNEEPHWNPVLFTTPDGETLLFFKTGKNPNVWKTWVTKIQNDKVVDDETRLMDTDESDEGLPRGPVRCKPVVLSNGDWIAPSSIESTVGYETMGFRNSPLVEWRSFVDISNNEGKTWITSKLIDFDREEMGKYGKYGGIIQPAIWESSNGHVHMLMRSTAGSIFRTDSTDYGKTWCEAYPTSLPNNNSGIDVVMYNDVLFLIYNPVSDNWGKRTPLSINYSLDNGESWSQDRINIEVDPVGSFSYPSMIAVPNGIAMTYTWNRKNIKFRKLNVTKENDNVVLSEES